MNIFVVDDDPRQAARDLCNKHVPKMLVETAQLLSTALRLRGEPLPENAYRSTHAHHPCTLWVATSVENASWTWHHGHELSLEYTRRFGKVHRTAALIDALAHVGDVDYVAHTPFALAMPDEWKSDDAVDSYRAFYVVAKSRFAKWKPRAHPPKWWPFKEE